jgi:hypothetical protein
MLVALCVIVIGGFVLIAVAPTFKLYQKAGRRGWLSLIPGANVLAFAKITGSPFVYVSAVSFAALIAFCVWAGIGLFPGGVLPLIFGTALVMVLVVAGAGLMYAYPLLSASMLLLLIFLLIFPFKELGGLGRLVLLALTLAQTAWDVLAWNKLLRKLRRPAYHLVFLFVPVAALLAFALLAVMGLQGDVGLYLTVFMIVELPLLFTGFIYYYYLGYSLKVRYFAG